MQFHSVYLLIDTPGREYAPEILGPSGACTYCLIGQLFWKKEVFEDYELLTCRKHLVSRLRLGITRKNMTKELNADPQVTIALYLVPFLVATLLVFIPLLKFSVGVAKRIPS